VADLALEVAGGWWTRFAQIQFGLQLLNASYFELFYSCLACGTPTSSVHRECFQFRRCDAALSHCALQTVLVSLVLPTRTPEAMMKLPIEYLLGNSCVIHTNDMSTTTTATTATATAMTTTTTTATAMATTTTMMTTTMTTTTTSTSLLLLLLLNCSSYKTGSEVLFVMHHV